MAWLGRIGAVWWRPARSMRVLLQGDQARAGDTLAFMALVLLAAYPLPVARVLFAYDEGLPGMIGSLFSLFVSFALPPLVAALGLAVLVWGLQRVVRGGAASWPLDRLIPVVLYLWTPVGAIEVLCFLLRDVVGLTGFLFQPLGPFFAGAPEALAIASYLLFHFGASAALLVSLLRVLLQPGKADVLPASRALSLGLVALLLAGLAGGVVSTTRHADELRPLRVGDRLAGFALAGVDPNQAEVLEFPRSRPLVLEFWATWCPQCIENMPGVLQWAAANPARAELVPVHQGDDPSEVAAFVKARGWSGARFLVDSDLVVSDLFRVRSLPTVVVLSKDGEVLAKHVGAAGPGWLDQVVPQPGPLSASESPSTAASASAESTR